MPCGTKNCWHAGDLGVYSHANYEYGKRRDIPAVVDYASDNETAARATLLDGGGFST
jgi:hypothetical protein